MKRIFNKRNFINFVCLLVIVAAVFFGYRASSGNPVIGGSNSKSGLPADFPTLKAFKPSPHIELEGNPIRIAVELTPNLTEEAAVADILELYRWGRSQFGEVKRGDGYPVNLYEYGNVEIAIIRVRMVDDYEGGRHPVGQIIQYFWLDQDQIDNLFNQEKLPSSFSELLEFHENVALATQGTGGLTLPSQLEPLSNLSSYFPMNFSSWKQFIATLAQAGQRQP